MTRFEFVGRIQTQSGRLLLQNRLYFLQGVPQKSWSGRVQKIYIMVSSSTFASSSIRPILASQALWLLWALRSYGPPPDDFSYCSAINACGEVNQWQWALWLYDQGDAGEQLWFSCYGDLKIGLVGGRYGMCVNVYIYIIIYMYM